KQFLEFMKQRKPTRHDYLRFLQTHFTVIENVLLFIITDYLPELETLTLFINKYKNCPDKILAGNGEETVECTLIHSVNTVESDIYPLVTLKMVENTAETPAACLD